MPYRRPAPFDPARARAWLASNAVVLSDGSVRSWHNPTRPGYAYPEAAGLLLSLLGDGEVMSRVAARALANLQADTTGRAGTRYLFDEGVVLAGLLRYSRRGGGISPRVLAPLYRRFVARLDARHVTDRDLPPRWSTRDGPHLLKLAVTVGLWSDITADDLRVLSRLLDDTAQRCAGGRFLTGPCDRRTYLHAHCYATEGALRLAAPGVAPPATTAHAAHLAAAGAAWLASVQRPDGGLPAWHDGVRGWGPAPADVAAQAIRIWALSDRNGYAGAIDRATRFLDGLATAAGALRYHGDSGDLNTWATAFAVQAIAMATVHHEARHLL